jgi:hypothetical protein
VQFFPDPDLGEPNRYDPDLKQWVRICFKSSYLELHSFFVTQIRSSEERKKNAASVFPCRAVSEQGSLNKTGTDIFVNFSSRFK